MAAKEEDGEVLYEARALDYHRPAVLGHGQVGTEVSEHPMTLPASPRAAAEQAIAEALRRERMAPNDYKPMPDSPVPVERAGRDD